MAMDPRFSEGVGGPGRPPMAGGAAPRTPAPRPPQPSQPTVPMAPIGRPPNAVPKPATPGPGTASQAAGFSKPAAAPAPNSWFDKVKAMGQAPGWRGAVEGAGPGPSGGFMSPDQQARSAAVQAAPADAAKAAATNHFEGIQNGGQLAPVAAPAPAPAPAAAPAAAPARPAGAGAPAPPAGASSWSSTNMQVGGVGDPELDAALKGAVMENLKKDPFSPEVVAAEKARIADEGAAGLGSQRESIEADAVLRGIGRTGVAAQLGSEAESATRASVANQQRQTMTEFTKLSADQKQQAIGAAQNLASDLANRGISLQQLAMQREQMAAGRGGGGGQDNTIEIDNGDGTTSQVDLRLVDLMLNLGEGGMY